MKLILFLITIGILFGLGGTAMRALSYSERQHLTTMYSDGRPIATKAKIVAFRDLRFRAISDGFYGIAGVLAILTVFSIIVAQSSDDEGEPEEEEEEEENQPCNDGTTADCKTPKSV